LGLRSVEIGDAPDTGLRFSISRSQRVAIEKRMEEAAAKGVEHLLVASPVELVQHILNNRTSAWQTSRIKPVLSATLALADLMERRSSHG
jgi:hypothetical protein